MPSSASLRSIASRALDHVPVTFDERWLRDTWTGTHGRLGLSAHVSEVAGNIAVTDHGLTAAASIDGAVLTPAGEDVGTILRDVTLKPNGRLSVYHAHLEIDPHAQKSGFAKAFNERAFQRYEAAGVDDVEVTAALDAGGFVWARTGFELRGRGATDLDRAVSRAKTIRSLAAGARASGNLGAHEYARLAPLLIGPDDIVHPHTLTSVRELAHGPFGELALMGQSWDGIKLLRNTGPWYDQTSPTGIREAVESAAYLRAPSERPAGMQQAAQAVRELIPDTLYAPGLSTRIEQASSRNAIRLVGDVDSHTSIDTVTGDVSAHIHMQAFDDATNSHLTNVKVKVAADRSGALHATHSWESMPGQHLLDETSAAITNALEQAGARS